MPDDLYLPRKCTVVHGTDEDTHRALSSFRSSHAYVLLGAPGAGKTWAFEHEARESESRYVTARDFLTFDDRPEWHDVTLFIDGLDEKRAGSSDQRTALDGVRRKLDQLGRPAFRLSCREADWFGAHDRSSLTAVAPQGVVDVLRLDPLTENDVRALLGRLAVPDVAQFMAQARRNGVEALLENPHALEMLARSVASGGEWPTTRRETFERSCQALRRERNTNHRQATRTRMSEAEALEVAGRLCALLLLAGKAAYVEDEPEDDTLSLSKLPTPDQGKLREVIGTLLFDVRDGCFVPRHRHVAEYLGGHYLAELVERGLSEQRVLALLTGFDGGIVSELRGLAAWMGAHSARARAELTERDPLGSVLYGDVKGYSVEEKRAVIRTLEDIAERDPSSLTVYREMDARWGDLATEDMAPVFAATLGKSDRSEAGEAVAVALLESLARGSRVPGMAPLLLNTVRDDGQPAAIRELSLLAYLKQGADSDAVTALADDIHQGKTTDPHDHLLHTLLRHLYPRTLRPESLVKYFGTPNDDRSRWLDDFWLTHVPEGSSREQLAIAMDALVGSGKLSTQASRRDRASYLFRTIPGRWLSAYLRKGGADPERLFQWLALIDPSDYVDEANKIQAWFAENPDAFKAVFRISAEREQDPLGYRSVGRRLTTWLRTPDDFGEWCLELAVQATQASVANYLGLAAARLGDSPDWDAIRRTLKRKPELVAKLKRLWEDHQDKLQPRQHIPTVEARRRQHRRAWRDSVDEQLQALNENRAGAGLLHDLAEVYFGRVSDLEGDTPTERLLALLGEERLVAAVLRAFVLTIERGDLPTEREVLRLAAERRSHYLSLPLLAGLDQTGAREASVIRLGLAILFNDAVPDDDPAWYGSVAREQPKLVAQMLIKSARRGFRRGGDGGTGLYRLDDPDHAEIAKHAIVPVLRAFPTRSTTKRLPVLTTLLRVALVVRPKGNVAALARAKLATKSMDAAQRMHWLCAGLLTGGGEFVTRMRLALADGDERRVRQIVAFFSGREWTPLMGGLGLEALELLIRSVGGSYGPMREQEQGRVFWVTPHIEGAGFVRDWIERLAAVPSPQASMVLEDLIEAPSLARWRRRLRHARANQLETRRNVTFRHASVQQVLDTLDGSKPANAGDLAALTEEMLNRLAGTVRSSSTSDWHQYWKTGLKEPEHEEDCRDRLLSDLRRECVRHGVRAEPEGRYRDQKRADIKVSFEAWAVPVEIKKSSHRDLWTAMRKQLMGSYTHDVEADGYGIYLVLWFGSDYCQVDPEGQRADNAEDLRDRLLLQLSTEESRKISVCVFDVSKA